MCCSCHQGRDSVIVSQAWVSSVPQQQVGHRLVALATTRELQGSACSADAGNRGAESKTLMYPTCCGVEHGFLEERLSASSAPPMGVGLCQDDGTSISFSAQHPHLGRAAQPIAIFWVMFRGGEATIDPRERERERAT